MEDKKNEEEAAPSFSVHDRRRVNPDSDTTSQEQPGEESHPENTNPCETSNCSCESGLSDEQINNVRDMANEAARSHHKAPEVDFTTFVISLASSAVVHLGEIEHPEAGKSEINMPMAKQVIDMLAMLKEKTRGNLNPDEERYLESILYDLRLRFVDVSGKQSAKSS